MKKYQRPLTVQIQVDFSESFLAGSVRNDGKKIMDGSTDYEGNEEGDGSDAGAKPNFFFDPWND